MDRLSEEEIMKYIKVTYRSEPIGKEGIVLELTTFDIEKWKNDKKLEHIPEKREKLYLKLDKSLINSIEVGDYVQSQLINFVTDRYEKQLLEMKQALEISRKIQPLYFDPRENKKVKNITNCDNVECDIVYGNIVNCDNVYCNEIKGNVINCDEIIKEK